MAILEQLLQKVVENNASDLHISTGNLPSLRIDGILKTVSGIKEFSKDILLEELKTIMNEVQFERYVEELESDFSISISDGNRFRVNAFYNLNGPAAAFRLIPKTANSLEEINAPKIVNSLSKLSKGLILVTGPTGSGKSTTLSAMVENMNQNYNRHIITIEDPIEFIHKSKNSLINQREVGSSTLSFNNALRSSLREDPDVIMVGELRDLESIRLALTAAETGHLVLATLHTNSATETINRIIDVFPSHDKTLIRSMLSVSLQAIIGQRLVAKIGGGRCATYEILIANNSIRNLIREDKIPQISSMMDIGKKYGMVTLRDSLTDLIAKNLITKETAEWVLISLGRVNLKDK
ncbi:MAG: type IV pilus twitching motility protein PilT [Proteobacteria bacterium]|nr:type IV pilus twitching motility protein PilT [Pseudomonadota bacterium]